MAILTIKQRRQTIAGALRKLEMYEERYNLAQEVLGERKGLRDMTESELVQIQNALNGFQRSVDPRTKMRMRLLSQLHHLGYIDVKKGKNDYTRANEYIANIGKHNPRSVNIFQLTYQELERIITELDERTKTENSRWNRSRKTR